MIWTLLKLHQRTPEEEEQEEEFSLSSLFFQILFSLCVCGRERGREKEIERRERSVRCNRKWGEREEWSKMGFGIWIQKWRWWWWWCITDRRVFRELQTFFSFFCERKERCRLVKRPHYFEFMKVWTVSTNFRKIN
jgi:hypothetical protein